MSHPIPTITVTDLPTSLPEGIVFLDVREDDEWEAGHIDGAIHIPLMTLPARVQEIPAQAKIIAVCHVGGRSAQATAWLNSQGHDVVNLDGGMDAWIGAGLPTVR